MGMHVIQRGLATLKSSSYHDDEFIPEQNVMVEFFINRNWVLLPRGHRCGKN
jgi:hypothetical protein